MDRTFPIVSLLISSSNVCAFQISGLQFNGYSLQVTGNNNGNAAIPGGEVKVDVWIKIIVWISAYSSVDPTCSYTGTDCDESGQLVGPNTSKTFTLTMGDETPPA